MKTYRPPDLDERDLAIHDVMPDLVFGYPEETGQILVRPENIGVDVLLIHEITFLK
ncbi:MAG TPA: hypothetical protein PK859_08745 [Spirochaetota bacterium]|nr:hypothetical protein [Spirochaetota bacterium]HPR49666.1 hypothetical protein [Spirochaetota bacterium]